MPVDPDLAALMPHTVTIEPWTGQDQYTGATYGAGVAYKARVERRNRMVRASDGQERVSSATVYLDRAPGVSPKDRITLPDGARPPILAVEAVPDERGSLYEAVFTV